MRNIHTRKSAHFPIANQMIHCAVILDNHYANAEDGEYETIETGQLHDAPAKCFVKISKTTELRQNILNKSAKSLLTFPTAV